MNMNTYPETTQPPLSIPPPFSWWPVPVEPSTRGGRFVVRRFGVAAALGDLVAELAGIGLGQEVA